MVYCPAALVTEGRRRPSRLLGRPEAYVNAGHGRGRRFHINVVCQPLLCRRPYSHQLDSMARNGTLAHSLNSMTPWTLVLANDKHVWPPPRHDLCRACRDALTQPLSRITKSVWRVAFGWETLSAYLGYYAGAHVVRATSEGDRQIHLSLTASFAPRPPADIS